jgi:hypothetical protein
VAATFTQNGGNVTTSFNAPAAGTYNLVIKYSTTTVRNHAVPSPPTVTYSFSTNGVGNSTATINLHQ